QVRTRGRGVLRAQHFSGAVDRLESEHDVLDLPIARGELAGAARGEPTADGGAIDAGREMAERRARRPEKLLETLPVEPRLHVRGARGELDVRRAGKPLQI